MRIAFTVVLLASFAGPVFAQRPRSDVELARIKLLEATLNLFAEVLKTSEVAQQQRATEGAYKLKIAELENKLKDANLTLLETLRSKKRLIEELSDMSKTIQVREILIVKLQADVNSFRLQAIANEARARTSQLQNKALLEQLRELTGELARIKAGANPDPIVIRNPNEPNPPGVLLHGKIQKVDAADGSLVQISLGTEHGLKKNHTLDVYRVQPEVKYLGMIRIVEANHQNSIGRLVTPPIAADRQLKVGDLVSSKITK